jgi:hypothetical protein
MHIGKTPKLITTLLFGLLVGCGQNSNVGSNSADEQQEEIFSDIPAQQAQDLEQTIQVDGTSLKKRLVKVNLNAMKKLVADLKAGQEATVFKKLRLNVFNGEDITVLIDHVEKVSDSNIIYTGEVAGEANSSVSIVINDDVMQANIRKGDDDQAYEVRFATGKVHTINLKKDEPEDPCPAIPSGEPADTAQDVDSAQDTAAATGPYQIDILGAYTPNARIKVGGTSAMIALLQLGAADATAAAANSNANYKARIVGTIELKRNETGNWSNDLGYLKGKTDGRWDEVHAKRAAVGADQVTVIATYPYQVGTNGIGYVNSGYTTAFTIVRTGTFGAYTFAHELGHNLGANHSDGYVNYSGRFRTIMAYGSQPRIRRYSNPYIKYNGYTTGTSSHYTASIIRGHAYKMSTLTAAKM